jgi:hypothetical protein
VIVLSGDLKRTDFCLSLNITWVITSRKIRWAGHVARTGRKETHTSFDGASLEEGDYLHDTGKDGRKY